MHEDCLFTSFEKKSDPINTDITWLRLELVLH